MTSYDALAELAERELQLAAAGRVDELPKVHAARRAVVAGLPAKPPAHARPALERAAALQDRVTQVLQERAREIGTELGRIGRGRTAIHGYAPPVEPLKLVDRAG